MLFSTVLFGTHAASRGLSNQKISRCQAPVSDRLPPRIVESQGPQEICHSLSLHNPWKLDMASWVLAFLLVPSEDEGSIRRVPSDHEMDLSFSINQSQSPIAEQEKDKAQKLWKTQLEHRSYSLILYPSQHNRTTYLEVSSNDAYHRNNLPLSTPSPSPYLQVQKIPIPRIS